MAYGLPRRNTVQTILKGSCYKVSHGTLRNSQRPGTQT
uniref:1700016H13Rik protein n=1 Tax=Mus musculus TaxID=10090 RepID=Q810Q2_MOUSE|nr:1700016H13Rik protein [Mus musculus]